MPYSGLWICNTGVRSFFFSPSDVIGVNVPLCLRRCQPERERETLRCAGLERILRLSRIERTNSSAKELAGRLVDHVDV